MTLDDTVQCIHCENVFYNGLEWSIHNAKLTSQNCPHLALSDMFLLYIKRVLLFKIIATLVSS